MKYSMDFKGFKAQIKEAHKLTGEGVHGLPSGSPLPVYYVDEFVNHNPQWVTGPGSFVVPVKPEKGLWFDWTGNDSRNTAVLPTVKGANPITGQQTLGFHLERYEEKCPVHDIAFQGERYCEKCDYKWPPQNYVAAPNTLWWDGFRSEDGHVRQFFFTADSIRDIPTHLIGKEKTIPAFGFAFYSPKEPRKAPPNVLRGGGDIHVYNCSSPMNDGPVFGACLDNFSFNDTSAPMSRSFSVSNTNSLATNGNVGLGDSNPKKTLEVSSMKRKGTPTPVKEVSIGAGAKIAQDLNLDSYSLDSWKEKPDAVMVIYFIFQEEFEKMKAAGMKDLEGKSEGMLNKMPVG